MKGGSSNNVACQPWKEADARFGHLCVPSAFTHTCSKSAFSLLISHSGTTAMSVIFLLAHTVFFSSFHFIPNKEFITAYGISRWHCVFNPSCSQEGTEQNNKTAFLTTSLNNDRYACVNECIDLTTPWLSMFPKLPWSLLEECLCFPVSVSIYWLLPRPKWLMPFFMM